MKRKKLEKMLHCILRFLGRQNTHPFAELNTVFFVYEDKKLIIREHYTDRSEEVTVVLKKGQQPVSFGQFWQIYGGTTVYERGFFHDIYREGKWTKYIANDLYPKATAAQAKWEEEQREAKKRTEAWRVEMERLNHSPIDDSDFF